MIEIKMKTFSVFLLFSIFSISNAIVNIPNIPSVELPGKLCTYKLLGNSTAIPKEVPPIPGEEEDVTMADCYPVGVYDMDNHYIGEGEDCLAGIMMDDDTGDISLYGTTYFRIGTGELVVRGHTSVMPVVASPEMTNATHLTGAYFPGEDSLVSAAGGIFKNVDYAEVRLHGAVDMSVPGYINFDCLFHIRFKSPLFNCYDMCSHDIFN